MWQRGAAGPARHRHRGNQRRQDDARGAGIATAMLTLMEHEIKKAGVKTIFLEVSAENAPAIALYKKCGFIQNGRRPKYYDGVDAILMVKNI